MLGLMNPQNDYHKLHLLILAEVFMKASFLFISILQFLFCRETRRMTCFQKTLKLKRCKWSLGHKPEKNTQRSESHFLPSGLHSTGDSQTRRFF